MRPLVIIISHFNTCLTLSLFPSSFFYLSYLIPEGMVLILFRGILLGHYSHWRTDGIQKIRVLSVFWNLGMQARS